MRASYKNACFLSKLFSVDGYGITWALPTRGGVLVRQELVDKLALVTCPTFFDLGGLEFSGNFTPPAITTASSAVSVDGNGFEIGALAAAAAAAISALGAVTASPGHQTLRTSLSGIGAVSARSRYLRTTAAAAAAAAAAVQLQPLTIPAGQHITLYNATLLLTAEQVRTCRTVCVLG